MRRAFLLAALAAVLAPATAVADLQPVRRDFGELTLPVVRAGAVVAPKGHARGVVTVLVTLRLPPLAAYSSARTLAGTTSSRRLDVHSDSSRAYLARIAAEQARLSASIRRAVPRAAFGRSLSVVLNALTVRIPVTKLPTLVRLAGVRKVYPSLRFTLALNRSPSLIGATEFENTTGARGEGVKIAVVDDGVDQTNPFFDPSGYSYPGGFPKGNTDYTTPKVIVARAYPGPGSGRQGRLPLERRTSFHGTHVAGIAAGNATTTAPAGPDHPATSGLTGVAPRAQIGNYRVFNAPTPIGYSAFTPEIVAAFEDAVSDGMDVINFSGGGPQNDPTSDALVEVVANVAAAGVVPVISAGNDRDEFGLGSAGAPGTAPEAISVAAVSNSHVFGPALTVLAPAGVGTLPITTGRPEIPDAWSTSSRPLVDVGTIVGTDGKAVDRYLCGSAGDPNGGPSTLPPGSLTGAIALASRGYCTFVSKAQRVKAAGGVGLVLVDNRSGEANGIPVETVVPNGMIADADGARLRAAMAALSGRATVRIGKEPIEHATGRGGTPTSFSSAGLTAFGHDLKPDVSAPGGAILSSTLRESIGSIFAVFDGTSMAAPHVAGVAALLKQRHPTWGAREVKSALMSTAVPAWGDTARTAEAPVFLEGAGLVDVGRADDPMVFTNPQSLSFRYLNVSKGGLHRTLLATISDAGGGFGTWSVELRPQAATAGTTIDVPAVITVPPGGDAALAVTARASAAATPGDNMGFVVLKRGAVERRIPYGFSVTRPGLADAPVQALAPLQTGSTADGPSLASAYRFPAAAFGPSPSYTGPPVVEPGSEDVYVKWVTGPALNVGVSVVVQTPGAAIDPWFLGSKDENDVTGYTGTPVNVNGFLYHYRAPVGAAGLQFPRQGQYFVSVDSGSDDFTGKSLPGRYVLRSWVDDVSPPLIALTTELVSVGRPTLVFRTLDDKSGVDPASLTISYAGVAVGAAAYDPVTGVAIFPLPEEAPALKAGPLAATLVSGDFQETKNVDQAGEVAEIFPNTAFAPVRLRVVNASTLSWVLPDEGRCVAATEQLLVVGSSPVALRKVEFYDGKQRIAADSKHTAGMFSATWRTGRAAKGEHTLLAVLTDASGGKTYAPHSVRVCRK